MNDGTCLNVSDGFRCICKPYFKGIYCEQIEIVRPKEHSEYFPAQDAKPVMFATVIATISLFICCFVGMMIIQHTEYDKQDTEDNQQLTDMRLAQSGYDSYS
ncbi:EGF domain containing protein [Trichuris trichiura]|uniref:EGF domain containing protein n=1 Tax=Trichuris trichiura TaxID=36087 RepID=A0A077ZBZ6_TRITR|nr:EGF domain containing protein [Trichuris trichiura]